MKIFKKKMFFLLLTGAVLAEETTTEEVPDGEIPFTSIKRKTVNGENSGTFFGGSYSEAAIAHGSVGKDGKPIVNFVPVDVDTESEFDFGAKFDRISEVFDKQREIFEETGKFFGKLFGKWFQ